MTREELIAALEAATGPDRELDAKIWHLIGLTTSDEAHCVDWCGNGGRTDLTRDRYIAQWARPYTSSIDAALTLAPETDGKRWYEIGRAWSSATARVRVYPTNPWDGRTREAVADAPTPALALCIAALKARAP